VYPIFSYIRHSNIELTFLVDHLSVLEGSVLEAKVKFLGVSLGETLVDHLSVGVDDAVEGETGSLDGVLVHFVFIY
jgi:hypothetical protein